MSTRPTTLVCRYGRALARVMLFVAVIGGFVAMHTLGHLAIPHGSAHATGDTSVSWLAASTSSASAMAVRDVGSGMDEPGCPDGCLGKHQPGGAGQGPGHGFDFASVCVAVLTAGTLVLVLLRLRLTRQVTARTRVSEARCIGLGWVMAPPRPPSLAELSVLRL